MFLRRFVAASCVAWTFDLAYDTVAMSMTITSQESLFNEVQFPDGQPVEVCYVVKRTPFEIFVEVEDVPYDFKTGKIECELFYAKPREESLMPVTAIGAPSTSIHDGLGAIHDSSLASPVSFSFLSLFSTDNIISIINIILIFSPLGSKAFEFVAHPVPSDPTKCKIEFRINVLTTQHNNLNFKLRIRLTHSTC